MNGIPLSYAVLMYPMTHFFVQAGPAVAGSSLVSNDDLGKMVTQAFAVIDVNQDEKISFDEFHKWALGQGHLISAAFS